MTIKDIARESGYAVGTVSRVLNNHPDVSEKARQRVLAVVEKTGFILNTNAQNLKQTVSRSILVLVKGTHNELFAALVEQLQGLVKHSPYTLIVDFFDEDTDEVLRAVKLCAEKSRRACCFWAATLIISGAIFPASPCRRCWSPPQPRSWALRTCPV